MGKLQSSLLNMVLSLGAITIIAAMLLGGVYALTKDTIADAERKAQVQAISEVAPTFDNNPLDEQFVYVANAGTKDSSNIIVYPAKVNGALVGAAVKSVTKNGFSGEIEVMCGFDLDGTVLTEEDFDIELNLARHYDFNFVHDDTDTGLEWWETIK